MTAILATPQDHQPILQDCVALRGILDQVHAGVYFVDRARRITYWNAGAAAITGYQPAEVVGRCCSDNLLSHVNSEGCQLCFGGCPLTSAMRSGAPHEALLYLRHREGHRVPVQVCVSPLHDAAGELIGAVETFSDHTAADASERRLAEMQRAMLTDPLTGLGNRRLLDSCGAAALIELQAGIPCGALCLDLDNFKTVNDSWGHAVGDQVLQLVARTVKSVLREEDTVVRAGGEEFTVLLQGVEVESLLAKAELLRTQIAASALAGPDGPIQVTVSIGLTMGHLGDTIGMWLGRADAALYRAKQLGRNRVLLAP